MWKNHFRMCVETSSGSAIPEFRWGKNVPNSIHLWGMRTTSAQPKHQGISWNAERGFFWFDDVWEDDFLSKQNSLPEQNTKNFNWRFFYWRSSSSVVNHWKFWPVFPIVFPIPRWIVSIAIFAQRVLGMPLNELSRVSIPFSIIKHYFRSNKSPAHSHHPKINEMSFIFPMDI